MTDWKHCTLNPPPPGEVYLVLEYRGDHLWQHHVVFYGLDHDGCEMWDTDLEMERCWYVVPPLTLPDISEILLAKQEAGEA